LKQLIINADDFGLTAGVSEGVLRAMQRGVVCSTSAMVCDAAALSLLRRHLKFLDGRAGIHLQLTDGVPRAGYRRVPSLVTSEGCFPRFPQELGALDANEVRVEWCAQLEQFLRSGLTPSHIDTHHHVHGLTPVFKVYCEIAKQCGVPARTLSAEMTKALRLYGIRCADYCETGWFGADATPEKLLDSIAAAFERCSGSGVVELMCHPGYVDPLLEARSVYVSGRENELHILCADQLARRIRQLGVRLAGMDALGG